MTELVVGCPAYRREWILGRWFDHVEAACEVAGVEPAYAFVIDIDDIETCAEIGASCVVHDRDLQVVHMSQRVGDDGNRGWSDYTRLEWMVELRNALLRSVRETAPLRFLSLDSDILLHRDALKLALDGMDERGFHAVGLKAHLQPSGLTCPNYCQLVAGDQMHRPDHEGLIPCDVLMAAKLMTPAAYAIDYQFDHRGEDLGWSRACRAAGLKLGHDGRVCSKHVMFRTVKGSDGQRRDGIDVIDHRAGF